LRRLVLNGVRRPEPEGRVGVAAELDVASTSPESQLRDPRHLTPAS